MEMNDIENMIDELRSGKVKQVEITKEDFLQFRSVLVQQEDFKQFHGIAKHGGNVVYEYLSQPRS
ncbi:hypothetical protein [Bacillus sp. FJAT-50079]|uniref:hypothetical protein n=1 Tax=Bacillus sp. FJAT-50079 TaxID=2833577 RepID=UPI001BCA0714|nr:hypothetical protein [Bacillus sp. FJAT-50079]MBS4207807.1 hypothetical protein [Bacillus sp. FJAT-50079]